MAIQDILTTTYFGNTGENYLISLGLFLGLFLIFWCFDKYLIHHFRKIAKKTKTNWDDIFVSFLSGISWFFYFYLALYVAFKTLKLPEILNDISFYILIVFIIYYVARGISKIIDYFVEKQVSKRKEHQLGNTSMMKVFGTLAKVLIWSVLLLVMLSNLGIEITPLIASLGIGGIAIALAFQAILGDLFNAFVIYFDKPFKEGDFIIIGDDMGIVEHIGIKSTRIKTLQGQELVVSNTELTSTRVNNYKRMEKRRISFGFGVTYNTGIKNLKEIKKIVARVIKSVDKADLDRVHFKEFGSSSLNFEIVYYIDSADYNEYMDIQEKINLNIYKEFERRGIEFAFPTQTIHLDKRSK